MPQPASFTGPDDAGEREARLLADLVRLSPATVVLAEKGSEKTGFLESRVLPLLAASAAGHSEVCILFDNWADASLPKLLAQIRRAIPVLDRRRADEKVPSVSLAATLARWQHELDATFVIVFDRFEEHLLARDRPGAAEFEDELVRVMNMPELRTHFIVALEADAARLLEPLRERIPGLGDTLIRLPRPPARTAPAPEVMSGAGPKTEPLVGSAPPEEQPIATPDEPARSEPRIDARPLPVTEARADDRSTAFRMPRAAWAVLGLLLATSLGLLLLTIWQPRSHTADTVEITATAPNNTGKAPLPDANTNVSTQGSAVASPADDQMALPLIQGAVPRAESSAPAAKTPASPAATAPRPITTLLVHVRSDAQRKWAEQLVQPLARRGIRVTGIRVVNAGPGETDLRYFHPQEAGEAARIARALRDVGVPPPRVKRIAGYESRSTPRQYELWLTPGTPKPPKQPR